MKKENDSNIILKSITKNHLNSSGAALELFEDKRPHICIQKIHQKIEDDRSSILKEIRSLFNYGFLQKLKGK